MTTCALASGPQISSKQHTAPVSHVSGPRAVQAVAALHCPPAAAHAAASVGAPPWASREVEDLPRGDRSRGDQVDELRKIAACGRGPAVQVDVAEEQILAVEMDAVWNTDIAHVSAWLTSLRGT